MIRRFAFAALLAAAPAACPLAAQAHAVLLDSTPAPNAHVPPGNLAIHLRYNSKIDAGRSKLTLTGPGGHATRLEASAGDAPATLAAHADVAPGGYTLRWQVLAIDGHITRGSVPFTVDPITH